MMTQQTYKLHSSKYGFFLTLKEKLTPEQAQTTRHFQTMNGECYQIVYDHSQIRIKSLSVTDQARLFGMVTLEEVAAMFQQVARHIPEGELRKWDKGSFKNHFSGIMPSSWEVEVEIEQPSASDLLFGGGAATTVKITKML